MPLPLGDFLIKLNATVDIEAVSVADGTDGGVVESFPTVLASSVPVYISQFGGGRDTPYGTDAQTDRGTISGNHTSLGRSDVRLKVVTAPDGMSHMVGWYLRVVSATSHPGGVLMPPRVRLTWSRVEMPRHT